jgi:curved DNA-binding protein CbpA
MALKFHPDKNKEAEAEDRFKEVGEAYEVLRKICRLYLEIYFYTFRKSFDFSCVGL